MFIKCVNRHLVLKGIMLKKKDIFTYTRVINYLQQVSVHSQAIHV